MNKIQKTDHFYLIDGSGYIFRAYYALPPLSRKSDGLPTGAVSGFCSMLFKLLEDARSDDSKNKPTHFAVIFDSARKNFRNDIKKRSFISKMEAKNFFRRCWSRPYNSNLKKFLNWLLDNESKLKTFNNNYLIEAVFHSCKNKAIIVRKDEKEKNIRAILNLGHTFGHAIEAINNYQKSLTHGEAVSIGIMMALDMSSLQGNSLNKNINKIKDHFQKLKMKTKIPNNIKSMTSLNKFKEIMNSDKKVKNNHINLILLRNLGKAYLANRYSNRKLDSVINKYIN